MSASLGNYSNNVLDIAIIVHENVSLKIFQNCSIFLYFLAAIFIFDCKLPFWLWHHWYLCTLVWVSCWRKLNTNQKMRPSISCDTQHIQLCDIEAQDGDNSFILSYTESLWGFLLNASRSNLDVFIDQFFFYLGLGAPPPLVNSCPVY